MALEFATGTLLVNTGAATTTYTVTGKTGTWKAVFLYWSGRPETTDAAGEGHLNFGYGVATSSTARWAINNSIRNAGANSAADRYHTDVACVVQMDVTGGGTVTALADFVAFTADGFTLVVDDAFPAALEVSYVLLGGADLTDVACGNFALNGTAGDQSYTSVTAFQPDFALFGAVIAGTPPGTAVDLRTSLGAATPTIQAVLYSFNDDAQADSGTSSYCFSAASNSVNGECIVHGAGVTSLSDRISFSSFLSTGFQLNRLEGSTLLVVHYLALKGGRYSIGDFVTATNTTAFTEAHGLGTTPKGAMFFSANRAESTQDAAVAVMEWSVGASDGSTNNAQYVRDKDNAATIDAFNAVSHDQCYYNADDATTQVMEGEGHVNSFDATNINFQMTDADPVASFVWYAAFGDAPAATAMLRHRGMDSMPFHTLMDGGLSG